MYLHLYRSKSLRFKITIREANVLANVLGSTNTWNVTSTTKSLLSKFQEKKQPKPYHYQRVLQANVWIPCAITFI